LKRKRGRPRIGLGFRRISVSMERDLLRRVTELARKRGLSRSKLFALVLEQEVTRAAVVE
jgi:metal-responsive CopG/Arc/MetJ family transcriptional regulator